MIKLIIRDTDNHIVSMSRHHLHNTWLKGGEYGFTHDSLLIQLTATRAKLQCILEDRQTVSLDSIVFVL